MRRSKDTKGGGGKDHRRGVRDAPPLPQHPRHRGALAPQARRRGDGAPAPRPGDNRATPPHPGGRLPTWTLRPPLVEQQLHPTPQLLKPHRQNTGNLRGGKDDKRKRRGWAKARAKAKARAWARAKARAKAKRKARPRTVAIPVGDGTIMRRIAPHVRRNNKNSRPGLSKHAPLSLSLSSLRPRHSNNKPPRKYYHSYNSNNNCNFNRPNSKRKGCDT